MTARKKITSLCIAITACVVAISIACEWHIDRTTAGMIFFDIDSTPHKKVGVLFGTAKYVPDGRGNLFYKYRITAAVQLFSHHTIDMILVSGDNSTTHYNEPEAMREDLIEQGIPPQNIVLDYAGFSTLDSVIRTKKVFQENDVLFISQKFQLQRALYLAHYNDIRAIGYAVQDVPVAVSPRVWLRERAARIKAVFDVFFHTSPKFLGDPITITATTTTK